MRGIILSSVALAALAQPIAVHAQVSGDEAPSGGAEATEGADDRVIVVTAQRRAQDLQEVPLSVTAFSGETLEEARINDVIDLQTSTPGFQASTANRPATSSSFFLRGFGTAGSDPGIEAAVGLIIDDVYRARSGNGLGDLIDISSLEVLRGPQGTLFGKNTTAGVIKVSTRRPNLNDFEGFGELTAGNFDLVRFRGAANVPVAQDTAALRFSFGYQNRDGFVEDPLRDTTYNDRNRFTFSGKFLWEIAPGFEAYIIGDYSEIDESCCQSVRFSNPANPLPSVAAGLAAARGATYPNPPTPTEFTTSVNRPVVNTNKDRGIQLQLNIDLGGAELSTVTAYRKFDDFTTNDVDFSGADLLGQEIDFGIRTFTQEVRLQGDAFGGRLDWLVGGFFSDEKIDNAGNISIGGDLNTWGTVLGLPAIYPAQEAAYGNVASQKANSYSLFTHNIFEIADGLNLTAGLRWTREEKDAVNTPFFDNFASNLPFSGFAPIGFQSFPYTASRSESDLSGTASLSYQFTPDVMTYASYSRGFKAGGIALGRDSAGRVFSVNPACSANNTVALAVPGLTVFQCDPLDPGFEDETVDSYELGLRSQFWDRRITLNLTAFRADISDLQQNTFTGTGFFVSNAGAAQSQGIEFEGLARVSSNLSLGGNISYLDTEFGPNVPSVASGEPPLAGQDLGAAPEWSGAIFARLELPVSDTVEFYARPEYYFQSSTFTSTRVASDGSELKADGYGLLNVAAGLRLGDQFEVSAFCRNCTDEAYNSLIFSSVFQPGSKDGFLGNPAEYGVSLRFEW